MKRVESLARLRRRLIGLRELKEEELRLRKEELALIHSFAAKMIDSFGGYIFGIVVFGSVAKGEEREKSDIDVLVLINDIDFPLTSDVVGTFRTGVAKILADLKAADLMHISTLGIKEFWDGVRHGDPVVVDILRKGYVVVDTGFFSPMKKLLKEGRIRPSKESVEAHLRRARAMLMGARQHLFAALDDLYWATIDSAHAALMARGLLPPSPGDVPGVFEKEFVKKGIASKRDAKLIEKMYVLMKKIVRGEKRRVSAEEVERARKDVREFVKRMEKIIKKG
jgi:predicted nucleotidyltransferase/uncharacterized protein (UPF0332 family)